MIQIGEIGDEVAELQRLLASHAVDIDVDGHYGPETEGAVRAFQRAQGLAVDGIAGPATWRELRGEFDPAAMSEGDIEQAAEALGVDVAAIHAVTEVESRVSGFLDDGRPVILYERHQMRRELHSAGITGNQVEAWQTEHPGLVNAKPGGYRGGAAEHERLDQAKALHEVAALSSCSWGAFQIMGYHATRLGYQSVPSFVDMMETSEGDHLDAFVRFVKADPSLHQALIDHDWEAFARGYNGPAYDKHDYDLRLAAAYRRHRRANDGVE